MAYMANFAQHMRYGAAQENVDHDFQKYQVKFLSP